MFCQCSDNQKQQQKITNLNFVCVGVQSSGKTSLLQCISEDDKDMQTYQTKGFNMKAFKYKKVKITICDCGGDRNFRSLWDYYYQNVHGIIYVIDSTNDQLMEETGQELINILNEPILEKKPLLILNNKTDLESCWDIDRVQNYFGIKDINDRAWGIFPTSQNEPDTVKQSLVWLIEQLIQNFQIQIYIFVLIKFLLELPSWIILIS